MKKIISAVLVVLVLASCKNNETEEAKEKEVAYKVFGDSISAEGAITKEDMFVKYKDLKEGDTVEVKFASKIKEVCQKKGCWMQLELPEENSAFVKFKDYGFFVPLNAANSEVIVNGKAFVSVESVEELRHYAKDAGESQAAIDSIVKPETTYSFMANGVLLKK
ncbi:MAG: DUF4920 domain-containing protein [Flavobacterium sp.]|nr:DUF4920 domain-containing protein [Flavobacterium sp.]